MPSILGVAGAGLILSQLESIAILSGSGAALVSLLLYLIFRRAAAVSRTPLRRNPQ